MEISSRAQAENGADNTTIMTPLRVGQAINSRLSSITDPDLTTKSITLNNEWIMGYKASGDNFSVILPMTNPEKRPVIVSVTSAEVYEGGAWKSLSYVGITAFETFVKLGFSTSQASLTNGNTYLCRIEGTLKINN